MLNHDQLARQIDAYKNNRLSLEAFENWFEDNSAGAYTIPDVSASCAAVSAAFSRYYFDHIGEAALKQELVKAVLPFAPRAELASAAVYVGQHMTFGQPIIVSGNNSVPIFQERTRRYVRPVKAEGRTHSAYTYAPMEKDYGFGHPLEDPDLATQVLPLHAEPA